MSELVVVSRADCGLCEEMLEALAEMGQHRELPPARVVDVDADVTLKRRYGLKVPVLLLDGAVVCHGQLDAPELERLLSPRR